LLDDFLVFRDRLIVSFFLDETLGGQEHLLTIDRHFVLTLRRCVDRSILPVPLTTGTSTVNLRDFSVIGQGKPRS
jgi:hypothetical protein